MPLLKPGNNSFVGNSFFIFITRFFPSLANLLVLILYSRSLPQALNGQYQRFWVQLNVIYPIICFGIHVLIITYSRGFIIQLLRNLNAKHYILYALWGIALSALFAWLTVGIQGVSFIIPFLFILAFSASVILESFLIVCKSYNSLTVINVCYSVAYCVIHWYLLHHNFSFSLLFFYLLVLVAIRMGIYAVLAISNRKGSYSDISDDFKLPEVRSLWLHLGLYDVTQMLFSWIDKFIVMLVLTAPLSAIYFIGSQNIPFLPLLLSAAGSTVLMQMTTVSKASETDNLVNFMNRSGRVLSCIIFPLFFFLLFFRKELIITLFTEKYTLAIPVFAVSVLVLPVRAYSFTTVLQRLHKGNIINVGSLIDLILACALMYPLYKWLGLPGVALSFVITTYLQAAFYLFYSGRLLGISPLALLPYKDWFIKLVIFGCLFIVAHYMVSGHFTEKIALILGIAVMAGAVMASLYRELIKQKEYGNG